MPTFMDSSDDEYKIGPPLEVLVADEVMKKIIVEREHNNKKLQEMMEKIITTERERADKKFAGWKIAFDLMTVVFFMMTIALVVVGYVVYTMPVKIVINVPRATAGQCSVEDDFMHDFNAFEEPLSDETLVTEHNVYQDMFQQAYVLGVSVMKSKHVGTTLAVSGPLAICGAFATAAYLSIIGY
jgi:hypothetical protein